MIYQEPPASESMLVEVKYDEGIFGPGRREVLWLELAGDRVRTISPQHWPDGTRNCHREGKGFPEVVELVLDSKATWSLITPKKLQRRGQYHPRIYRNGISDSFRQAKYAHKVRPEDQHAARTRCVAFHRIQRQLLDIFEMVSPIREHAAVFGAGIQQVLTLAAREVETLLRAVFEENVPNSNAPSNMANWHALYAPMRLGEWSAALRHFPDWGPLSPFRGWTAGQAPAWWTAYNKFKHEEDKSDRANLGAAISAVSAIRILLETQFGPGIEEMLPDAGLTMIDVTERPRWSAEELYFAPPAGESLVPIRALG